MIEIREMDVFSSWLARLRDQEAKVRIAIRIRRLAFGNAGDVAPAGEGLSEVRIHHGAGYRVYFVRQGPKIVVLLRGGDKASQQKDFARAKALANEWKE